MTIKLIAICFVCLAVVAAGSARAANPVAVIETSMGTIKVELYEDKAPITVKNFIGYANDKFYDGTIFHRVMGKENSSRDFMIQGGGMLPDMSKKKTKDPIANEATNGLANQRGTLAMARTMDPNSATSQFFVNVVDNGFLDKAQAQDGFGYCVFARVIEGMDVVDKIKAVPTGRKDGQDNVPTTDVLIKSVKIEKK